MTRDEIIAAYPLLPFLEARGHKFTNGGAEPTTLCPFHDDHHPSLRVNAEKGVWRCDPCDIGGSVIDYVMRRDGIDVKAAMRRFGGGDGRDAVGAAAGDGDGHPDDSRIERKAGPYRVVDTYTYTDEYGNEVYWVDREENSVGGKRFKQYRMDGKKRINNIDGIQRMLWRLPDVLAADEVFVAEGEKCVQALAELGYTATTNPGGSNGWRDGYADMLSGKDVVLVPDNDKPGKKWQDAVLESLQGKVRSVRLIHPPKDVNDVADIADADERRKAVETAYGASPRIERGVSMPLYTVRELDEQGRAMLRRSEKRCLHLGRWLPTLGNKCRPRFPGDLVTVLADTGVGKTAVLQNLAWCARMPTLFFGMELSGAQMGERMLALSTNQGAPVVQRLQKEGAAFDYKSTEHIVLCPESGLTIDDMTHYIERADLKLGERPALVLIDYIGLVRGGTGSRYERLSQAAESIKVMAKETDTVVVVASQVHRPSDKDKVVDPGLHDAKDSGSIENSSQLVLGLSRPNNGDMTVRVLKDTTGGGVGTYVECNFHGATFRITERAWTPGAGE